MSNQTDINVHNIDLNAQDRRHYLNITFCGNQCIKILLYNQQWMNPSMKGHLRGKSFRVSRDTSCRSIGQRCLLSVDGCSTLFQMVSSLTGLNMFGTRISHGGSARFKLLGRRRLSSEESSMTKSSSFAGSPHCECVEVSEFLSTLWTFLCWRWWMVIWFIYSIQSIVFFISCCGENLSDSLTKWEYLIQWKYRWEML